MSDIEVITRIAEVGLLPLMLFWAWHNERKERMALQAVLISVLRLLSRLNEVSQAEDVLQDVRK